MAWHGMACRVVSCGAVLSGRRTWSRMTSGRRGSSASSKMAHTSSTLASLFSPFRQSMFHETFTRDRGRRVPVWYGMSVLCIKRVSCASWYFAVWYLVVWYGMVWSWL